MKTVKDVIEDVQKLRGKSAGWPSDFEYSAKDGNAEITLKKNFNKENFRRLDPWGLAFIDEIGHNPTEKIKQIVFAIDKSEDNIKKADMESFLRRISFLALNNKEIKFIVKLNGAERTLYETQDILFNRPDIETIREESSPGSDEDKPGRIEKDFQTFLFGKDSGREQRTNERLAILGEDFYNLKKKELGIMREFATGVFKKEKSEKNRILPTEFIDIVTLNKYGEIAIIELKLNDSKLEVISQILDYALFFRCYKSQLLSILGKGFKEKIKKDNIVCYVANNHFHPRFNGIKKYYTTDKKGYKFEMKQIILGQTETIK